MADMTTSEKLADARAKYHKLVTGAMRVTVRDGDSTIEYTPANASALAKYISDLEGQLAVEEGTVAKRRTPAGVIF